MKVEGKQRKTRKDLGMKIYKITFDNYERENFIELYHKKENALARYHELMEEGKNFPEFNGDESSFSYFNNYYNEYSTYIYFDECELSSLFFD